MAALTEAAGKAEELKQNLEGAAAATGSVSDSAKQAKESIEEAKNEAENLRDVARNTSYSNFLESINVIKRGLLGITGIFKKAIAIPKAEREYQLRMEKLRRTLKYVDFGKWHDIDFAKMHLNELRKFDIAAQASGSTAKNVKALEYSMKKFGGTAQDALRWTKSMQSSLADMEWGGEGGALGQVAFEYGLDFTGNESQEDIDEKIANLLDTLPKRQQVRVAQMLGIDDANFKRLTDKDANGKLTLKKNQEEGLKEAEKTTSDKNLSSAKKTFEADQQASIAIEQQNIRYAVDNIGTILSSIQTSADKAYAENVKKLEDKTFQRYMERAQAQLTLTYAPLEHYISQFERIIGLLAAILDVVIAIKAFNALGGLGGIGKGAGGLLKRGGAAVLKWGENLLKWGGGLLGSAAGGATAVGIGMAASMMLPLKLINDDVERIEAYRNASPEEKKKMREKSSGKLLTKYFDQADATAKRKAAEGAAKLTADETAEGINARFNAVYKGVDLASDLSILFSKNFGFGGTTKAERALISERLKKLSPKAAASLLDDVNALDKRSVQNGGRTPRYLMDREQRKILEDRKNGVVLATEEADSALQTAGQNLSTANAGAAEMIGTTVQNAKKLETHDSYVFNVKDKNEAMGIYGDIQTAKDNVTPFAPNLGTQNASADADVPDVK